MAKYRARVSNDPTGVWLAAAVELPNCWSSGPTRDAALERLREEIRYRIEFCPCSSVDEAFVQVDVQPVAPQAAPVAPHRVASERRPDAARGARQAPVAPLSGVLGCPPEPPGAPAATSLRPTMPPRAAGSTRRAGGWRRWDD